MDNIGLTAIDRLKYEIKIYETHHSKLTEGFFRQDKLSNEKLLDKINSHKKELEIKINKSNELETIINRNKNNITELEDKITKLDKEINNYVSDIGKLEDSINLMEKKIINKNSEITELEKKINFNKNELEKKINSNNKNELETIITNHKNEMVDLETIINNNRNEIVDLEKKINNNKNKITELQLTIINNTNELENNYKTKLAELKNEITKLDHENNINKQEILKWEEKITITNNENRITLLEDELQKQVNIIKNENEKMLKDMMEYLLKHETKFDNRLKDIENTLKDFRVTKSYVSLGKKRIVSAANALDGQDLITKSQLDKTVKDIENLLKNDNDNKFINLKNEIAVFLEKIRTDQILPLEQQIKDQKEEITKIKKDVHVISAYYNI